MPVPPAADRGSAGGALRARRPRRARRRGPLDAPAAVHAAVCRGARWAGRVSRVSRAGTNGLAIAALCCGLAAVVPVAGVVAIVLGVVALHQLRQARQAHGAGQRGRGMAIAGIVLGTIGTLVWAGLLDARHHRRRERAGAEHGVQRHAPAPAGRPVSPEIFVDDLEAGDCFSGGRTDQIDLVNPIPCTSAHESQVVTIFELPDEPYPGEDEVIAAAEEGCADKADPLLTDAAYDDLEPSFIYPDSYTWRGDRTVLCLVEAPTGTTTGSALK